MDRRHIPIQEESQHCLGCCVQLNPYPLSCHRFSNHNDVAYWPQNHNRKPKRFIRVSRKKDPTIPVLENGINILASTSPSLGVDFDTDVNSESFDEKSSTASHVACLSAALALPEKSKLNTNSKSAQKVAAKFTTLLAENRICKATGECCNRRDINCFDVTTCDEPFCSSLLNSWNQRQTDRGTHLVRKTSPLKTTCYKCEAKKQIDEKQHLQKRRKQKLSKDILENRKLDKEADHKGQASRKLELNQLEEPSRNSNKISFSWLNIFRGSKKKQVDFGEPRLDSFHPIKDNEDNNNNNKELGKELETKSQIKREEESSKVDSKGPVMSTSGQIKFSNSEFPNNSNMSKGEISGEIKRTSNEKYSEENEPNPDQMSWNYIARRYGQLPSSRRSVDINLDSDSNRDQNDAKQRESESEKARRRFRRRFRQSCLCNLIMVILNSLFPILRSFDNYSLPGDLLSDFWAGITVAIIHIPQGMAYGLLAGVDPIYGLYVSLIPVVIMSLMSRSHHVSYGTFAIISMMIFGASERAKAKMIQHFSNTIVQTKDSSLQIIKTQAFSDGSIPMDSQGNPLVSNRIIQNLLESNQPDSQSNLHLESNSDINVDLSANPITFTMPSNIEILTSICILVGLIQVVMSIMRLGMLSLVISDQLVSSFTTGSAIHVVTSQIGSLFDLNVPRVPEGLFRVCRTWYVIVLQLIQGFNRYTALLSVIGMTFLLIMKEVVEPRLKRRYKSLKCLPSELILMSSLGFASWYWQFSSSYDISIVGHIPTGLPPVKAPRTDLFTFILDDCIAIALVSYTMNLSLVQMYAKRFKYRIDPNHELLALGASNVIASFFSCFPCASSISRSAIQSNLGPKSPLTALFSCAIVMSMVCYFAPILYDLPRSTLSCIIVVALIGVLGMLKDFIENWRRSKLDAIAWLATFVAVLAFGVTYGLVIGIISSLFMVFFR